MGEQIGEPVRINSKMMLVVIEQRVWEAMESESFFSSQLVV
jgi:hypothetical protein